MIENALKAANLMPSDKKVSSVNLPPNPPTPVPYTHIHTHLTADSVIRKSQGGGGGQGHVFPVLKNWLRRCALPVVIVARLSVFVL